MGSSVMGVPLGGLSDRRVSLIEVFHMGGKHDLGLRKIQICSILMKTSKIMYFLFSIELQSNSIIVIIHGKKNIPANFHDSRYTWEFTGPKKGFLVLTRFEAAQIQKLFSLDSMAIKATLICVTSQLDR
jgi:hypothetical protein